MQYHCGGGGIVRLVPCLRGRVNISESVDRAKEYAREGLLDPLENLQKRKHYIHHGSRDVIIHFGMTRTVILAYISLTKPSVHTGNFDIFFR